MSGYVLGLDVGTNSLGWALVMETPQPGNKNIITGVRVFPEGTEPTKSGEQPRNFARRNARQTRRQLARRSMRKNTLRGLFVKAGIFPSDPQKQASLIQEDPYALRKRALDESLDPALFARALMHMNQRRGFKSNAKAQGDEAEKQGKVKDSISALEKQILDVKARTLGEYLAKIKENGESTRNRYTHRDMYKDEFEKIWTKQADFYPEIWTDALKTKVEKAMFFQRPLKLQDHLIGKCELEPEEKRCPRASWFAQQFRVLQELNNLRVLSRDGERELTKTEREALLEKFMTQISPLRVSVIKSKVLKLDNVESLNFEKTERDKMNGNHVEARLLKIFGAERFNDNSQWLRETVWQSLTEDDPDEFKTKAMDKWSLTKEEIQTLFKIDQPSGYFNYSLKAIKKLLPHLEQGMSLYEAKQAAGYKTTEGKRVDHLPPIKVNDFRNPVVVRSLSEIRKVVNAIIRKYGLPDRIVVEMARETKGTIKSRMERTRKNARQNIRHLEIDEKLKNFGYARNFKNREKYKLWEECDRKCPFTGHSISITDLFGKHPRFEVEHILPYSRTYDDSYINKTLCEAGENKKKNNRSPYEAYDGTKEYDEILVRVGRNKKMPYEKRRRFWMEEIPEDFTNRQLNDTSYVAKSVVKHLRRLGVEIKTTRGQITAELRRQWGLNNLLYPDADGAIKTRDDHRHHAIDAVAIAFTSQTHLNKLRHKYDFKRKKRLVSPWEDQDIGKEEFRQTIFESVKKINVSHRPSRRLWGQITKDTNYGATAKQDVYVSRTPLSDLTPSKAAKIVDSTVRKLVLERLAEHGIKPGKGPSRIPASVFEKPLFMKSNGKKGPVIKKVRIKDTFTGLVPICDDQGRPYKFVKTGSNHHVAIFEYKDANGKPLRCKEIVSRFEAHQRLLRHEPIISKTHPNHPEAKFLMSLCIDDMVLLKEQGNAENLYRVQTMSAGKTEHVIDLRLRLHTASSLDDKKTLKRIGSLFLAKKVTVDPVGVIHPAND